MIRSTLVDFKVWFNYYPFMVRLDKCSGSFNSVDDLSTNICVRQKT